MPLALSSSGPAPPGAWFSSVVLIDCCLAFFTIPFVFTSYVGLRALTSSVLRVTFFDGLLWGEIFAEQGVIGGAEGRTEESPLAVRGSQPDLP